MSISQKKLKAILFSFSIIFAGIFFPLFQISAEEEGERDDSELPVTSQRVDYNGEVIVDSDLDGLTDKGEQQIFGTDPALPDTDGDGFFDGVEVMNGTNPLDIDNPLLSGHQSAIWSLQKETPWAWYVARMSGLIGFVLLYISIFLGMTIRIPFINRIFKPIYTYDMHCWISVQALIFAFIHGVSLVFDKYLAFRIRDVFIPYVFPGSEVVSQKFLALGIIGFYLMIVLVLTSYLKKYISHKVWRITHSVNIILYIFVVIHALMLGTDLKNVVASDIFIALNELLLVVFINNFIFRIRDLIKKKRNAATLHQSESTLVEERGGENNRKRI